MIPLEDALQIVLKSAWRLPDEQVPLADALHRVLAVPVCTDVDIPPFDKASMDGYACRRTDLARELQVLETIPAGKAPQYGVGEGECAKIMTGAPVPEGADCVFMVEHAESIAQDRVRFVGAVTANNICHRGEDLRAGDEVVAAGTWLLPQHLAALAAAGCAAPEVARAPRVGILATGDELLPPDQPLGPGQIRNSNSLQLEALVRKLGGVASSYGIVPDEEAALSKAFAAALAENDLVISTGGVSMGDYDLVPKVLQAQGLDIRLRRVAMQPGKPLVLAVGSDRAFFGLSGNPVSSFVQFELLVKPLYFALQGGRYAPPSVRMCLAEEMRRKNADRTAWVPVQMTETGQLAPVPYHGSAHLHALGGADGLICFPQGQAVLEVDTPLPVWLCR